MKTPLILPFLLLPLLAMAQPLEPYRHNFFTTNPAPVVQAVAGSNVFITYSAPGTATRTYTIDVPSSGAATNVYRSSTTNGSYIFITTNGFLYEFALDRSITNGLASTAYANGVTNGFPWGVLYDPAGAATAATNGYVWTNLTVAMAGAVTNGYPWTNLTVAHASAVTNGYPWTNLIVAYAGAVTNGYPWTNLTVAHASAVTNGYPWTNIVPQYASTATNVIGLNTNYFVVTNDTRPLNLTNSVNHFGGDGGGLTNLLATSIITNSGYGVFGTGAFSPAGGGGGNANTNVDQVWTQTQNFQNALQQNGVAVLTNLGGAPDASTFNAATATTATNLAGPNLASPTNTPTDAYVLTATSTGGATAWKVAAGGVSTPTNYDVLDFKAYGGKSDGVVLTNCWMTSGTNLLICSNATFAAGDIGKSILVCQAGTVAASQKSYDLSGTITNVLNPTNCLLSVSAGQTATNMPARYGTDDATNLQNAIYFCRSNHIPRLRMSGVTIIAGTFQFTNSWNSLIIFPMETTPDQTIHPLTIEGVEAPLVGGGASPINGGTAYGKYTGASSDGTWIMCNNPGDATIASATRFPASMFCGGTNVDTGWPASSVTAFNNVGLSFRNIGIRTASNPLMGAINMIGMGNFNMDHVNVDSSFTSYGGPKPDYTYGKAFGVAMPANGNNGPGQNQLRNVCISSFYVGMYAFEHTEGDNVFVETCLLGVAFAGASHAVHFGHLSIQGCASAITSTGAATPLQIDCLDLEHNGFPTWLSGIVANKDIVDASHFLRGNINYKITSGLQYSLISDYLPGTLIVDGGTNLTLRPLGQPMPARSIGFGGTNMPGAMLTADLRLSGRSDYHSGSGTNAPVYASWTTDPAITGTFTATNGYVHQLYATNGYTVCTQSKDVYLVNSATNPIFVLPDASTVAGREFLFSSTNYGTFFIVTNATGTQPIANGQYLSYTNQDNGIKVVKFISDGAAWWLSSKGQVKLPSASWSCNTNITFPNVTNMVTLDTQEANNGVGIALDNSAWYTAGVGSRIWVTNAGMYLLTFSAMWSKVGGGAANGDVWLRQDGAMLPRTMTLQTIQNATTTNVMTVNFILPVTKTTYFDLVGASPDGTAQMQAMPAITTPFARPAAPSMIVTIQKTSD